MHTVKRFFSRSKGEDVIYNEQMETLMLCFSNIDDLDIREGFVKFCKELCKLSKNVKNKQKVQLTLKDKKMLRSICDKTEEENLPYLAAFSRYIGKIDSIALKDQTIEMVKIMAS